MKLYESRKYDPPPLNEWTDGALSFWLQFGDHSELGFTRQDVIAEMARRVKADLQAIHTQKGKV